MYSLYYYIELLLVLDNNKKYTHQERWDKNDKQMYHRRTCSPTYEGQFALLHEVGKKKEKAAEPK